MNPFDKMLQEFKNFGELQTFAESQYKTILQLSKKNHQQDEEIKHLKSLLQKTTPLLLEDSDKLVLSKDLSDEEVICRTQLKLLKEMAVERELTLEECRKTETYNKILLSLTAGSKEKLQDKTKKMDDNQLLALLEHEVTSGTK